MNDHKGNGKVERLLKTVNERLSTNKNIDLEMDKTGFTEMLYALRGAREQNKLRSAELHNYRKFTTVKDLITAKPTEHYTVLDNGNISQLKMSAFPGEQDSEILVRERARVTKFDGLYKKKQCNIVQKTTHTVTISNEKRQPTLYSKRDVTIPNDMQATTSTTRQPTREFNFDQSPTSSTEQTKNAKPT